MDDDDNGAAWAYQLQLEQQQEQEGVVAPRKGDRYLRRIVWDLSQQTQVDQAILNACRQAYLSLDVIP